MKDSRDQVIETNQRELSIKVFRYDPTQDIKPRYEEYKVPNQPRMRVLDALLYIREHFDSSLAFRWSCRGQRCGTCAVMINGEPGLACWAEAKENMTIEPLPILPVVRDLVVDRREVENRLIRAIPFLERLSATEGYEKIKVADAEELDAVRRCVGCLSCVAACPVVDVAWDQFAGPELLNQLARFALDPRDDGDRLRTAFFEGLFNCTTCAKCQEVCPHDIALPRAVVERLRQLAVADGIGPLEGHVTIAERAARTGRVIERTETPLVETAPEVSAVSSSTSVGFFTGCLVDYRLQKVGRAVLEILDKNGIDIVTPRSQVCCGSPLLRTGQVDEVLDFVRKNVEAFENTGVDTLITTCPGCTMTLRNDYPQLSERVIGRAPKFKVLHLSEFLVNNIRLKPQDMRLTSLKVTYHDPCHLRRKLGIHKEPRELLHIIPGIEFIEMEKADRCCGAGGGMRAGRRDLGYLIVNKKLEMIRRSGADTLATACPFCELQLSEVVGGEMEVVDIAELLVKAYG